MVCCQLAGAREELLAPKGKEEEEGGMEGEREEEWRGGQSKDGVKNLWGKCLG